MNIMIPILVTILGHFEISDIASNELTTGNATKTEQTLTDSKLNKPETEENSMNLNTGDRLVIVINEQN